MRNIAEDPEKARALLTMAEKIRQRIQETLNHLHTVLADTVKSRLDKNQQ